MVQTSNKLQSKSGASSMAELMSRLSSRVISLKKGDIVEGTIKKLTLKEITMDIGAKSDALVLEFDRQNADNLLKLLKVGDRVKASVLSPESEEGFPVVSLRRTLDDMVFLKLENAFKSGGVLEVYIFESTRGGFFAETDEGVRGFLPNSQVIEDHNITGKVLKVKIIEFDREKKRVIFSEKAIVYIMNPNDLKKVFQKEQILDVSITNVASHGIYVSLQVNPVTHDLTPIQSGLTDGVLSNGVKENQLAEGFIHISEVSYQRVENLQSFYKKGAKIKAQVIDVDEENRRVNLSIKRLEKDTFQELKTKYKKDQKLSGVVCELRGKGAVVKIEDNVLGFIPDSKIPSDVSYSIGDKIETTIEDFDDKRRVIILTPVLKVKPIGYR